MSSLIELSRSLAKFVLFFAVLFLTGGNAGAQNTNIFDNGSGDGTWTGANWNINGTPGQTVTPTVPASGTQGPTYGPLENWIIGAPGAGVTISEANQIRLDGGTLNAFDSTISLDSASSSLTSNASSLNIGDLATPTTANFTNSIINLTRANSGNGAALQILGGSTTSTGGSQVVFDSSIVNCTSATDGADANFREGSMTTFQNRSVLSVSRDINIGLNATNFGTLIVNNSSLIVNGTGTDHDIQVEGNFFSDGAEIGMAGGPFEQIHTQATDGIESTVTMNDTASRLLFLDLDDPADGGNNQFLFGDGCNMTLFDPNGLRANTNNDGDFDWVVTGAGTSILTQMDNSSGTAGMSDGTDLAQRFAGGYFSLNGGLVDPTTAYLNDDASIAAINNELLTVATAAGVGTLYFRIDGTANGPQSLMVFVVPIPEPTSCLFLGVGFIGIVARRRRR